MVSKDEALCSFLKKKKPEICNLILVCIRLKDVLENVH